MQQFIKHCLNPVGIFCEHGYHISMAAEHETLSASCHINDLDAQDIDKIQGARREALRQLMPGPESYKLTKTENGSLGLPTDLSNFILDFTRGSDKNAVNNFYKDEKSTSVITLKTRYMKSFIYKIPDNQDFYMEPDMHTDIPFVEYSHVGVTTCEDSYACICNEKFLKYKLKHQVMENMLNIAMFYKECYSLGAISISRTLSVPDAKFSSNYDHAVEIDAPPCNFRFVIKRMEIYEHKYNNQYDRDTRLNMRIVQAANHNKVIKD